MKFTEEQYKGYKPLIDLGDAFIAWKKGELYLVSMKRDILLSKMPMSITKRILCQNRLTERIFRMFPRCGVQWDEDVMLISFHGGIYSLNIKNSEMILDHRYIAGMNNPLTLTTVKDIDGFKDGVYYGEYTAEKRIGSEVAIWRKVPDGWEIAYKFPKDSIKHIHAIIPDKYRQGLIVLTGDSDEESGIWLAKNDFQDMICLASGKQDKRSCVAVPIKDGIIYATDSPEENNTIRLLTEKNGIWESEAIAEVSGTVLYSTQCERKWIFSCTVEPDSQKKGLSYLFTRNIAKGIKDAFVRIYEMDLNTLKCWEINKVKKDNIPGAIGQFGTVMFATQSEKNQRAIAYYMAVKGKDNTCVVLR